MQNLQLLIMRLNVFVLFFTFANTSLSAEINFTALETVVAENATTISVMITRSGSTTNAASVTLISEDITAKSPADYQRVLTNLTWEADDAEAKEIEVTIFDDRLSEGDEAFRLKLEGVIGDSIGTKGSLTVIISDYEEGQISFSESLYSSTERDSTLKVRIVRTGGTDGEVSTTIKTADRTAIKDSDYVSLDSVVVFRDGEDATDLYIGLVNDEIAEPEEFFELTLSNPTGNALLGSITSAKASISDLDGDLTSSTTFLSNLGVDSINAPVVDLELSSFGAELNYLELINSVTLFQDSFLSMRQLDNGIALVDVGDSVYSFWPISASRGISRQRSNVQLMYGDFLQIYTDQDLSITFVPALFGENVFSSYLSDIGVPEFQVTKDGSITIRTDQKGASLVTGPNGEIVVSNTYYDRWSLRPNPASIKVNAFAEGVQLLPHPTYNDEVIAAVIYWNGDSYSQQILTPGPLDPRELKENIERNIGLRGVEFLGYGTVKFSVLGDSPIFPDATEIKVLSDYLVRRSVAKNITAPTFGPYIDVNQDGIVDFRMIYSNGDEQYFITKSYD